MNNVGMIGLSQREMQWVRLVVGLLRHPDPVVAEVSREALRYLEGVAARAEETAAAS
jgi:hypothetical protein